MANEIEINNSMSKVPKELDKQELLQEKDKVLFACVSVIPKFFNGNFIFALCSSNFIKKFLSHFNSIFSHW